MQTVRTPISWIAAVLCWALLGAGPATAGAPPNGTDGSASAPTGRTYIFSRGDWGFSDPGDSPPNDFVAVKIVSLPSKGTLAVSGNPVAAGVTLSVLPTLEVGKYWVPAFSGHEPGSFHAIAASGNGAKLIASSGEGFSVSTNAGASWKRPATPDGGRSAAISADGNRMFACAGDGYLYSSTDSGATWKRRDILIAHIASSADGTKLVGSGSGGIYTSTNSGASWLARDPSSGWKLVAISADGTRMAAINGSRVEVSSDSGASWIARGPTGTWNSLEMSADGTRLVAALFDGRATVYRSPDFGVNWFTLPLPLPFFNLGICNVAISADATTLITGESDGPLWMSRDSGSTWTTANDSAPWDAVACSGDGNTLAAVRDLYDTIETSTRVARLVYQAPLEADGTADAELGFQVVDNGTPGSNTSVATNRFVFLGAAASRSTIAVSTKVMPASGVAGAYITVQVFDSAGHPMDSGYDSVVISLASGVGKVETTANRGDGTYTADISSTTRGSGTFVATLGGIPVGTATASDSVTVEFVNSPPLGTDGSASVAGGQSYTFNRDSWGFLDSLDSPPNNFTHVQITGLPKLGTLAFAGVPVAADDIVSVIPAPIGDNWATTSPLAVWTALASSADGSKLVAAAFPDFQTDVGPIYVSEDSGKTWNDRSVPGVTGSWNSVASSADGNKLVACIRVNGSIYTSVDSGRSWIRRATRNNWSSVASSADGSRLVASTLTGLLYTSANSGADWTLRKHGDGWSCVSSSADGTKLVACGMATPSSPLGGDIYTSNDSGLNWTPRDTIRNWVSVASSADGTRLVACEAGTAIFFSVGSIYTSRDSGATWIQRDSPRSWVSVASSADGFMLLAAEQYGVLYKSNDAGVTWTPFPVAFPQTQWSVVASSADGYKLAACQLQSIYTSAGTPRRLVYTAPKDAHGPAFDDFTFRVGDDGSPGPDLAAHSNTFVFNGPDAAHSVLVPIASVLTADGISTQAITVRARDSFDNPSTTGGAQVTITKSSGPGTIGALTDNHDGTYTAVVTAPTTTGVASFTALLAGEPVGTEVDSATAYVVFRAGPVDPVRSAITVESASMTADGTGTQLLTVQARDRFGNPVAHGGATVVISSAKPIGKLGLVSDNLDGSYTAILTAPKITGYETFGATLDGLSIGSPADGGSAFVAYTHGSSLEIVAPTEIPSPGIGLKINLSPASAGGAWRFRWETRWRASGEIFAPLDAAAIYLVEFKPVVGFDTPPPATNHFNALPGEPSLINLSYNYQTNGAAAIGTLRVSWNPVQPTQGGWRIQSEAAWRTNGENSPGIRAGVQLVEFLAVSGFATPTPREVTVSEHVVALVSASYAPLHDEASVGKAKPVQLPDFTTIAGGLSATPKLPYPLVGQFRGESGFGSGIAVGSNVVLTAAHVLLDKTGTNFSGRLDWYPEKQAGEHEPVPIRAKGWYVSPSYLAARAVEAQDVNFRPDVSTQLSQQWDVAAVYFDAPAVRGGYSGYITPDLHSTDWLEGGYQSLLLGYPVGLGHDGDLFETARGAYRFSAVGGSGNRVFQSPDFTGYPGNSGGPLCVLSAGAYRPAAVYLGRGPDGGALVRAIDRDVESLILVAEATAQAGENYTGGGVIAFATPAGAGRAGQQNLRVNILPAAAAALATWSTSGFIRLAGDDLDLDAPATYIIRFSTVPGFGVPTDAVVALADGQDAVLTYGYPTIGTNPALALSLPAADGTMLLTASGLGPVAYHLEFRKDLVGAGGWTSLSSKVNANGSPFTALTLTNGVSQPGFYRLVVP